MPKREEKFQPKNEFNEAMGDAMSFMNSGMGLLSGMRREVYELVRSGIESSLQRMAVPTREEVDQLKERLNTMQEQIRALEKKTKKP